MEEKEIDGVFIARGHTPNVSFLNGFLELDEKGYIKTGSTTATLSLIHISEPTRPS